MRRSIYLGLCDDRRGVTAPMIAVALVVIVGIMGFVTDLGHAFVVQRSLQASADAAALAGAKDINCCSSAPTQALTTATKYSAVAGQLNAQSNITATMAGGYPKLLCLTSTGISCTGSSAANAIQVRQQATVPMLFAQVLGIKTMTVSATSTAGLAGGIPQPLNVMIVLDTTGSMDQRDSSCSIKGATKEACALAGIRVLLNALSPTADQIGLMVFPGLTNSSQAAADICGSGSPKVAPYNASPAPVYQIVGFNSNYRTSNGATTLNSASPLVQAAQGSSSCQGIQATGGVGTYYADAINAAQTALLNANGQANAQNVIIFLSDGDADASTAPTSKARNQCHEGIAAAHAATAAGTWVYSIAYAADTSSSTSCSTDSPRISACATMQQIASDSTKFFSDTQGSSNGCASGAQSVAELVSVFKSISYSLVPPRLLLNTTT
jgi:hypothetical protein